MNQLVVLLALASTVCGSVVPALWAQPAHHPALVLDPHGRPLDTAEVISARALHLQAKALEGYHHSPIVSVSAPLWHAHSAIASPWIGAHGHLLKKRSLGHFVHSAPVHVIAPAAVSHQSRVDVHSSPAVVSHVVAAPAVVAHAAPVAVAHAAPIAYAHVAPAAVSHQSRVDVHSSPAVVAHSVLAAPAWGTHSAWGGAHSLWGAHSAHTLSAHANHGHWLKKRSLGYYAHLAAPSAVSHQSRVDVISSPAVVSHALAAPLVYHNHAAIAPLAHSVHTVPLHYSHHGFHSSPLVHAW